MASPRRTHEAWKNRPYYALTAGDLAEALNDPKIALLQSGIDNLVTDLNTHKTSPDHDGRYYTQSQIATFLSYKADKARLMNAGAGLVGGGSIEFDRTFDVGAGLGIAVEQDAVKIDTAAELTWTKTQHFQTIYPRLPDTFDLGSMDKLWRKGWLSELSAVVMKEYDQFVMGGLWQISKQEGALPFGCVAADTQIDFGQAMTAGDFVLFRVAGQVEYMQVGALVSGTTYSVTRNLDGSGANDWAAGSVFAVLGKEGDGRILFDAVNTPRMSMFRQGATYNAQAEQIRIGDLNGNWGYTAEKWGIGIGEYVAGKANITIDADGSIRIRNFQDDVIKLTGTGASFEGLITLGPAGGIRQGVGTWGTNFTGLAIYRAGYYGTIAGINQGQPQWIGHSSGSFITGSGSIVQDNLGITLMGSHIGVRSEFAGGNVLHDAADTNINGYFRSKMQLRGGFSLADVSFMSGLFYDFASVSGWWLSSTLTGTITQRNGAGEYDREPSMLVQISSSTGPGDVVSPIKEATLVAGSKYLTRIKYKVSVGTNAIYTIAIGYFNSSNVYKGGASAILPTGSYEGSSLPQPLPDVSDFDRIGYQTAEIISTAPVGATRARISLTTEGPSMFVIGRIETFRVYGSINELTLDQYGAKLNTSLLAPNLKSVAAHSNTTWVFNPGVVGTYPVSGLVVSIDVPTGARVLLTAGVNCRFNTTFGANIFFSRGGSVINASTPGIARLGIANGRVGYTFSYIDTPGAGTFTYRLECSPNGDVNPNVEFLDRWLKAEILNE